MLKWINRTLLFELILICFSVILIQYGYPFGYLIVNLSIFYIFVFLSIFLHEVGHAFAGICSRTPPREFVIGDPVKPGLQFTIFNTSFHINFHKTAGYCSLPKPKKSQLLSALFISATGPLVNIGIIVLVLLFMVPAPFSFTAWAKQLGSQLDPSLLLLVTNARLLYFSVRSTSAAAADGNTRGSKNELSNFLSFLRSPEKGLEQDVADAEQLFKQGKFSEAESVLHGALTREPNNVAWNGLHTAKHSDQPNLIDFCLELSLLMRSIERYNFWVSWKEAVLEEGISEGDKADYYFAKTALSLQRSGLIKEPREFREWVLAQFTEPQFAQAYQTLLDGSDDGEGG
jgi:hypothetical protein